MVKIIFLICLALICLAEAKKTNDRHKKKFGQFKAKFSKKYKHEKDENARLENFAENLDLIDEHNSLFQQGLTTFQLGVNEYSDLSEAEFSRFFLGVIDSPSSNVDRVESSQENVLNRQNLPTAVDWRNSSAVTPVKNQGDCGSCWAFATIGSIETQLFKKTGVLTSLSEQQLVDCNFNDQFLVYKGVKYYGNKGCNGGYSNLGFRHLSQKGVMRSSDYSYTAVRSKCKYSRTKVAVNVSAPIGVNGESAIQERLANFGPIYASLHVSRLFQNYKSGIFEQSDCVSKSMGGHAILPVGYGSSVVNGETKPFWVIKNSWGPSWGEGGYIRILRNAKTCGFGAEPSYYSRVL